MFRVVWGGFGAMAGEHTATRVDDDLNEIDNQAGRCPRAARGGALNAAVTLTDEHAKRMSYLITDLCLFAALAGILS